MRRAQPPAQRASTVSRCSQLARKDKSSIRRWFDRHLSCRASSSITQAKANQCQTGREHVNSGSSFLPSRIFVEFSLHCIRQNWQRRIGMELCTEAPRQAVELWMLSTRSLPSSLLHP